MRSALLYTGILAICYFCDAYSETVYLSKSNGIIETVETEDPISHEFAVIHDKIGSDQGDVVFSVNYADLAYSTGVGFDDLELGEKRRRVVDSVLEYVCSKLNHKGQCEVLFALSEADGMGPLAVGGTFYWGGIGFSNGFAFEHITTGNDPSGMIVDIEITVDFGFDWHQDAFSVPSEKIDLFSVLLHEISHGLGIVSLSDRWGDSRIGDHSYTQWDSLLATGGGNLLFTGSPPVFRGTAEDLCGLTGGLFFTGLNAGEAHGDYPLVYTPNSFFLGSSLSHWDTDEEAVMAPTIGPGEERRCFAPFELGALKDLGYEITGELRADFDSDVRTGSCPLTVHFMDRSQTGEMSIASWNWDFGDAKYDTVQNPIHIYDKPGVYTVSLTVSDSLNISTESKNEFIVVGGELLISATSSSGGSIHPAGSVYVPLFSEQNFVVTPDPGFRLSSLLVDDIPSWSDKNYTFHNVVENHTIHAIFTSKVMPNLVGMSLEEARFTINALGLNPGSVAECSSQEQPAGYVVNQNPKAGATFSPYVNVDLTISSGPGSRYVVVPRIEGMTQEDAESVIRSAGLGIGNVTEDYSSDFSPGLVTEQEPVAGILVPANSLISFSVSSETKELSLFGCYVSTRGTRNTQHTGFTDTMLLMCVFSSAIIWSARRAKT